jgi:hypothetical protein
LKKVIREGLTVVGFIIGTLGLIASFFAGILCFDPWKTIPLSSLLLVGIGGITITWMGIGIMWLLHPSAITEPAKNAPQSASPHKEPTKRFIAEETMPDVEMSTLLRDSLQSTEASAWQKAALELNRQLVFAQVEATSALVKPTKATTKATYVLAAATIIVAAFSIIQGFLCLIR